jgi:hypothetical protein
MNPDENQENPAMEQQNAQCPNCDSEIPNKVLYQCISCYTKYCVACPDSRTGRVCPGCGQNLRMVLDQGSSKKGAA